MATRFLIIGGGPAGLLLSQRLHLAGIEPLLCIFRMVVPI